MWCHLETCADYQLSLGKAFEDTSTYVKLADENNKVFEASKTLQWNHGIGEIVQCLLDVELSLTGLVEHTSIPWEGLPGRMVELSNGKFVHHR